MEMKRNFMPGAGDNLKGKESLDKSSAKIFQKQMFSKLHKRQGFLLQSSFTERQLRKTST